MVTLATSKMPSGARKLSSCAEGRIYRPQVGNTQPACPLVTMRTKTACLL